MSVIEWHARRASALASAQTEQKPILLDFYNSHSIGCQQMETVTYPNKEVIKFVQNYLTPLRINVNEKLADEHFHHLWTPTVAILNLKGDEIERTVGFMEPEEFLAKMHLGLGKARLDAGEYDTAMIPFISLLETFPTSDDVPEAIYFNGVVMYLETNNPHKLKKTYARLVEDYPDSRWTKRAYPYRLLE